MHQSIEHCLSFKSKIYTKVDLLPFPPELIVSQRSELCGGRIINGTEKKISYEYWASVNEKVRELTVLLNENI